MRRLRKTGLAALVWLLAVVVTVDGFPRIQCRCPDGQVQTLYLGLLKSSRPCCAARDCARPGTSCFCRAQRASTCVACGQSQATEPSPSSGEHTVQAAGCVKSLLTSDHVAVQADDAVHGSLGQIASLPMHSLVPAAGVAGTLHFSVCQAPASAPPADLVTVLQRLVL